MKKCSIYTLSVIIINFSCKKLALIILESSRCIFSFNSMEWLISKFYGWTTVKGLGHYRFVNLENFEAISWWWWGLVEYKLSYFHFSTFIFLSSFSFDLFPACYPYSNMKYPLIFQLWIQVYTDHIRGNVTLVSCILHHF